MIFHVLHVIKSDANLTHHDILNIILQYIELSELSSAKLYFKKRNSVILIHNLNIIESFYNKTQLIVIYMHSKLIMNEILENSHNELKQCIFQMKHNVNEKLLNYNLMHKQFSFQFCFVIIINKTQRQLLQIVNINL